MIESSIAGSMQRAFSANGTNWRSSLPCLSSFSSPFLVPGSGAFDGMTSVQSTFLHTHPYTEKGHITSANCKNMLIFGMSTIVLSNLHNHLCISLNLSANLISVGQLVDNNWKSAMSRSPHLAVLCSIRWLGRYLGQGMHKGGSSYWIIDHPVVSFIATSNLSLQTLEFMAL